MYTGSHYRIKDFVIWTRRDIWLITVIVTLPTLLYIWGGLTWLAMPWVPVALVGTAAAFLVGFKNTQTYNRLWEARMIWGAIVNSSRSWGMMARDFVNTGSEEHRILIYRHCAWLTALRYQLRKPQSWEYAYRSRNVEFRKYYSVPEWDGQLDELLQAYLTDEERRYVLSVKNPAAQIISLQSQHLKRLHSEGHIGDYQYVELERRLADLYDQQGKCERIKNFPYPRQFSSVNLYFIWLFVAMLPFGMLNEIEKLGSGLAWLTIPLCVLVAWVFTSIEKVGEATENPFEGGANDIPMAALSRSIEIDLREMLGETELPEPLLPLNNVLM